MARELPKHRYFVESLMTGARIELPDEVDSVNLAVEAAERQARISGCRFKVYSETLLAEVGL